MKRFWVALGLLVVMVPMSPVRAQTEAFVRVDQVGYVVGHPKTAFILSSASFADAPFTVRDAVGTVVFNGTAGPNTGAWNDRYPFVHRLEFDPFDVPGTYTIALDAALTETPPQFRIGSGDELFLPVVADIVSFMTAQRDGPDVVPGALGRKPSHLADREAFIYALPKTRDGVLLERPKKIGGPIDVSGGWHDAGDYLKFTGLQSYSTALMLIALRDNPGAFDGTDALAEVRRSIDWLDRMYDESTGVLYQQVGLGEGNDKFASDHDQWRLPEADDALNVSRNDRKFFVKYRPVFRANRPGKPISPNLSGRVAATFGLCAQVFRATDPAFADGCLAEGRAIFAASKTTDVRKLQGAVPLDFYAETQWRDDLEWGAVELALAEAPGSPARDQYLDEASRWAEEYITSEGDNYPTPPLPSHVGPIAHVELILAGGAQQKIVRDLEMRIESALREGDEDPFGLGGYDSLMGVNGWGWTALRYGQLTGDDRFAGFVRDQVNWELGANPWGVSFVVGVGTTYAHCLHHQVANLSGALDGTSPILRGAVTYGPASKGDFKGLGDTGGRPCPAQAGDPYKAFTGHGLRFMDAAKAWPSVEPSIAYGALAILFLGAISGV